MAVTDSIEALNAQDLEQELAWFTQLLTTRLKLTFGGAPETETDDIFTITPPDLSESQSPYADFIRHYQFKFVERALLILSMIPRIRPQLLDVLFIENQDSDRRHTEFGGAPDSGHGGFIPSGETLLFILTGGNLHGRFQLQPLFDGGHFLTVNNILEIKPIRDEPVIQAPLRISEEYLSYFTTGQPHRPEFSADFPARYIETQLTWDDLVLPPATRKQIEEIETWLQHSETLMNDWGMAAKLRPGYRALFYGSPGTGKSITAGILGKNTNRDVYKVDLSMVVSKYIGETEKNLAKVFDMAQNRGWILFFDEADALFGKRSDTQSSHDRHANQEVSFLLQRIETFNGIAILASNRKDDMDEAFARRFETVVYFPVPKPAERLKLWQQSFSPKAELEAGIDLEAIAKEHELAGGAIINVVRYASLQALKRGGNRVFREDVLVGIRRELVKEGRQG